jgi:biotin carboxyl carrier protein
MNRAGVALLCVLVASAGVGTGWLAARPEKGAKAAGDAHSAEEGRGEKPRLSPQALKNLGVTVKEAETTTYRMYQAVPAVVTEALKTSQPLIAPIGGTVADIKVNPGAIVKSGTCVLSIIREPVARPALALTEHIIKPATDEVHSAFGDLRKSVRGMEILKTELERVSKFTQGGTANAAVLPRKTEIDLRYDIARAEQDVENAREKLRLHGFSDQQIAGLEQGQRPATVNSTIWKRALERNGLWNAVAEEIYQKLPPELRETAWTVAALGELVGSGLATEPLAAWLKGDAEAGRDFLAIAALLQQGHSLVDIEALRKLNALDPVVEIQAPSLSAVDDWDVREIAVKPFERVQAGATLAMLTNHRELLLKAEPVGAETAAVLAAVKEGSEITAVPVVEGTGQPLKGLTISYVTSDEHAGTVAFLRVVNEPVHVADEGPRGKFRTWQIRVGQRYMLRIPRETLKECYVVPTGAVADDGPDKVIFVQNGETFESRKVVVLHQDHEVAVLDSKDSDLFPGDAVVQHGAFGLSLALKAGSGAPVDAHAGHNH